MNVSLALLELRESRVAKWRDTLRDFNAAGSPSAYAERMGLTRKQGEGKVTAARRGLERHGIDWRAEFPPPLKRKPVVEAMPAMRGKECNAAEQGWAKLRPEFGA